MRFGSFIYLVKEGFKNVWFNRLMSLASIGVLTACLLLIGGAALLSANVTAIVGVVEDQNELVVFLEDELSDNQKNSIDDKIKSLNGLLSVNFISKEQALIEQQNKVNPEYSEIFNGLQGDQNPLPDSYRIKLDSLEDLSSITAQITAIEGVLQVSAPTELANTITEIKRMINIAGLGIIVLLIVVSVVIIANTIKITVFNRRKEIGIMKYVGATDSFIRLPFLVEGMLLGIISAVLAFGILFFGYTYLLDSLVTNGISWFAMISQNLLPFDDIALPLFAFFAIMGTVTGTVGSLMFVKKYLKV
ncbi:MAG: permease-like cell division protein FtsX [Oscillospiraceae bacterium]|nr:permease-like cell division protein FtsX [Oscillospiraceae bacterium]